MAVALQKRLLTVEEYHQIVAAGILAEDERVELIEGEIFEMAALGVRHVNCVKRLIDNLSTLRTYALLDVQNPIRLEAESSVPQPDLVLLRRRDDYYGTELAGPRDVLLLVEVADSSLAYDRDVKVPLYARSGIPEVWLVDLTAHAVSVYRQPSPDGYRELRHYQRGETLSPQAFPEERFSVDAILP